MNDLMFREHDATAVTATTLYVAIVEPIDTGMTDGQTFVDVPGLPDPKPYGARVIVAAYADPYSARDDDRYVDRRDVGPDGFDLDAVDFSTGYYYDDAIEYVTEFTVTDDTWPYVLAGVDVSLDRAGYRFVGVKSGRLVKTSRSATYRPDPDTGVDRVLALAAK